MATVQEARAIALPAAGRAVATTHACECKGLWLHGTACSRVPARFQRLRRAHELKFQHRPPRDVRIVRDASRRAVEDVIVHQNARARGHDRLHLLERLVGVQGSHRLAQALVTLRELVRAHPAVIHPDVELILALQRSLVVSGEVLAAREKASRTLRQWCGSCVAACGVSPVAPRAHARMHGCGASRERETQAHRKQRTMSSVVSCGKYKIMHHRGRWWRMRRTPQYESLCQPWSPYPDECRCRCAWVKNSGPSTEVSAPRTVAELSTVPISGMAGNTLFPRPCDSIAAALSWTVSCSSLGSSSTVSGSQPSTIQRLMASSESSFSRSPVVVVSASASADAAGTGAVTPTTAGAAMWRRVARRRRRGAAGIAEAAGWQ